MFLNVRIILVPFHVDDLDMTTAKYFVFAFFITQAFLEVEADSKAVAVVGLSAIVLLIFFVILCWCCRSLKILASGEGNYRPSDNTTPLIERQFSQPTCFEDAQRLLIKHRAFLRDRMDVDFGLLDVLLGSGTLSYEALLAIKSKCPFQERNGKLVDYLLENNNDHSLSQALKTTHQSHIANYVEADGVYSETFGGVWPLSKKIVQALDTNRYSLLGLIDSTELVNELFSKNVISSRHKEAIATKPTCYDRNETLLDIMRRLSLKDYGRARECFHTTKQSHIVQFLIEGGRIARVHADLRGVDDVLQAEEELVATMTHLLRNETTSYVAYVLEMVHLRLVGVTVGHSVICHFHCPTVDDLKKLAEKLQSGELEKSLETLFSVALPERHIAQVAVTSVDEQSTVTTASREAFAGSLEGSYCESFPAADDIETKTLYSILQKDLPVKDRPWKSSRSTKKHRLELLSA